MSLAALATLAVLFIHPIKLPPGARLWMVLPLVLSIAIIYRATRARRASEMPWPTLVNFFTIVLSMCLIAAGFYALHWLVIQFD